MTSQEKFKRKTMRKGGFTIVPNSLLTGDHPTVNGLSMEFRHRMLVIALMSLDYRGGWFKASRRILKRTGLGFDALSKATTELVTAGLLEVSSKPNCLTEYNLNKFYEWFAREDQSPPEPEPAPGPIRLSPDLQALIDEGSVE
jgi:hypothetical protein